MGVMAHGIATGAVGASSADDLQAVREEIQRLKEGQQAIQRQLQDIQKLLKTQGRPRGNVAEVDFTVNVIQDPMQGSSDAKVTLIEFTDYQCPYCALHSRVVLPQLTKDFIDTGKIRYVLRDFPLTSIHQEAAKAHEAAHCAGEQGKYWEMHDRLFAHQKELQADRLIAHAKAVDITDSMAFKACMDSGRYEDQAKASVAEGARIGVRGTPS